MSGGLQAVVEQGPDLSPQLPVLVVGRGHVEEELVLQQHVDVSRLQAAPAAPRPARGPAELRRQVVQHRALVAPPRLHLDGETQEVAGETGDLDLDTERERGIRNSASVCDEVGNQDDVLPGTPAFRCRGGGRWPTPRRRSSPGSARPRWTSRTG